MSVRAYDYWWGYTNAQIELMAVDVPVIVYKDNKPKHSKSELEDLTRRWKAKKEREQGEGKSISLKDFVIKKE